MDDERSAMRRERMTPDARREAILDAAQKLFLERGYDAVTIADVLDAACISKGGFYHHFTAKEDLPAGIVARMSAQAIAAAEAARDLEGGGALDRLNAFIAGSVRWKAESVDEMRFFASVLTRPGNDALFQRIFQAGAAAVRPILTEMIAQGVAEGAFDVADAGLVAELIISLSQGRRAVLDAAIAAARAGDLDAAEKFLDARMQAEGTTCDRLLGLPAGSVALSHPTDYRRMLVGLAGGDNSAGPGHSSSDTEA